jgi:hypothetical protein
VRWIQSVTPGIIQNGIYRRTDPGSYSTSPTATIPPNTVYQNDGLNSGSRYCYVVTAFSAAGESAKSAEACGTPK